MTLRHRRERGLDPRGVIDGRVLLQCCIKMETGRQYKLHENIPGVEILRSSFQYSNLFRRQSDVSAFKRLVRQPKLDCPFRYRLSQSGDAPPPASSWWFFL
jgi:hypothetical protein